MTNAFTPPPDSERPSPDRGLDHEEILSLIARILAGEKHLFHALIRPIERPIYGMLSAMLQDASEAEDAAQEAAIKVYRNLHSFRGDSKFSTWAFSIARNEGLARLRKRAQLREDPLENLVEESNSDYTPALLTDWREIPLEALERRELGRRLTEAVAALPPIYREVVLLRDVEELDIRETAALLQVSEGVVKVRLHRARMLLQRELVSVLAQYAPRKHGLFGRRA